jgi:hypothetical protein
MESELTLYRETESMQATLTGLLARSDGHQIYGRRSRGAAIVCEDRRLRSRCSWVGAMSQTKTTAIIDF